MKYTKHFIFSFNFLWRQLHRYAHYSQMYLPPNYRHPWIAHRRWNVVATIHPHQSWDGIQPTGRLWQSTAGGQINIREMENISFLAGYHHQQHLLLLSLFDNFVYALWKLLVVVVLLILVATATVAATAVDDGFSLEFSLLREFFLRSCTFKIFKF